VPKPVWISNGSTPAAGVEMRLVTRPIFPSATPKAHDSRVLCERVPVMSSTSLAARRFSNNSLNATLMAGGHAICRVSGFSGARRGVSPGSPPLGAPSPATPGTFGPAATATTVTTTIARRVPGTKRINPVRGRPRQRNLNPAGEQHGREGVGGHRLPLHVKDG